MTKLQSTEGEKKRPSRGALLKAATCVHGMVGPCEDCQSAGFIVDRVSVTRYSIPLEEGVARYLNRAAADARQTPEQWIRDTIVVRLYEGIVKQITPKEQA